MNATRSSRDTVAAVFGLKSRGIGAFWTGNPHPEALDLYLKARGLADAEQLFDHLGDDCRWIPADMAYEHPEGRPMFQLPERAESPPIAAAGTCRKLDAVSDVQRYPWPDPDYLDFSNVLNVIRRHMDKAVFTGMWSHFFHIVADLFGMEQYFIKMHTDPKVVQAVTDRVVEFCCEANRRFFVVLGDAADVFFFGNDLGTQLDLLISPGDFKRFVLPGFRKLIDVAKSFDKKVLLHTCGSVYKIIPTLIDAGIDGLHPLQARAASMDAVTLAREFGKDIAFVGGVDTQELLVRGTPREVRSEVCRLRDVLGPNVIISPSHEAVLPNIPLANIEAMAEAAKVQPK